MHRRRRRDGVRGAGHGAGDLRRRQRGPRDPGAGHGPANGTVTTSGLSATYTPAAGFSGTDSFRVKGSAAGGESAPATVTITVGAAPVPPGTTKAAPLALSLRARPKRDRTLPYKFRFSGRLTPAAGAPCSGRVVMTSSAAASASPASRRRYPPPAAGGLSSR